MKFSPNPFIHSHDIKRKPCFIAKQITLLKKYRKIRRYNPKQDIVIIIWYMNPNQSRLSQDMKPEPFLSVITKTCLYNVDPLKPHFYIVKLGFTGVYIIFHISAQNIYCGYSLEPPQRGGSNEYPQSRFLSRHKKNIRIFIWNFSYFAGKFSSIFE